MDDRLEIPESGLVELRPAVMDGIVLPGILHPGDTGGLIPPNADSGKHWLDMVGVVTVTDAVIERAYNQQKVADALGESGARAMQAHQPF